MSDTNSEISYENTLYYEMATRVYQQLGAGHTEFIYHRALEKELFANHINYEYEKRVLIKYVCNGVTYTLGEERIDLFIIDDAIIIELKATVNMPRETEIAQVKKYYRELLNDNIVANRGIIINFPQAGTKTAKEQIDFVEVNFNEL